MESLQLQEFFVEGGNQQKSHVLLHITEPSNADEEYKGNFFAIAELNNATTATILNLQKIIEEVESRYYSFEESAGEHGLEPVLKAVNLEYWGATKESGDLHCIVGVIRQKEIIFSYHGAPQILMFYKNKEEIYKKIDLISSPEEDNTDDNRQLFSQIIQGKISSGDYILATTPNVAKYFNQDRLQKITTTRPPRQIAEHLERVLSELRNDLSFGGLIIHLSASQTTKERPAHQLSANKKDGSEKSLRQLFSTEKQTADTLSPGLMTQLNGKINKFFKDNKTKNEEPPEPNIPTTPTEISSAHLRPRGPINNISKSDWQPMILAGLRQTGKGLKAVFLAASWLAIMIFKFFMGLLKTLPALFFVITNIQNRRRNVLDNWRRDWQNRRLYFGQLPLATKGLLIGAAITALIFFGSIWYLRAEQQTRLQNQKFEEQISAVTIKRDNAESALVYNDTQTALNELSGAKIDLKKIDCLADRPKIQRCEMVENSLDQLLTRLKKSYSPQLETVTVWPNTGLNNILKIGNLLIAFSSTSPSLYSYDLLTKQTATIDTMFTGFIGAAVPKENDFAVLLYGENELAEFSPENKTIKKIEMSFPDDQPSIQSITAYNRRLYSLNTANQQIYKHDRTKTGFGLGQNWVKSDNNYLSDANDITIDGDIFLTHKNGTASKWTNGGKSEFSLRGLYPALSLDSNLWTYNDLQYLYILDSIGQRLIIVDKNGELINQAEIPELSNPRGLVVEEKNKRAFIVDSGKLYQVNLP